MEFDDDLSATGLRLAPDETGRMPMLDAADETDLLDATGHTQILGDDMAVETAADLSDLEDDDATMLAPGSDESSCTRPSTGKNSCGRRSTSRCSRGRSCGCRRPTARSSSAFTSLLLQQVAMKQFRDKMRT